MRECVGQFQLALVEEETLAPGAGEGGEGEEEGGDSSEGSVAAFPRHLVEGEEGETGDVGEVGEMGAGVRTRRAPAVAGTASASRDGSTASGRHSLLPGRGVQQNPARIVEEVAGTGEIEKETVGQLPLTLHGPRSSMAGAGGSSRHTLLQVQPQLERTEFC